MAQKIDLSGNDLTVGSIYVGASTAGQEGTLLAGAELTVLDGVTAGTVTASKAAVVDSNKDIGDFRNLDVVNIDAGASGTAGSVDVFPSTASKGKVSLTAADSAGDTTTTIVNASQGGARTYTIPDAGASASFVMAPSGVVGNVSPSAVQQDLSGAGAVNLTTYYTAVTNTGADALTLADSTVLGQLKKVKMIVDPGTDSTLTFNGTATIVFADVGDYAVLMWNGSDWLPIELGNDADGETAPVYTPAA